MDLGLPYYGQHVGTVGSSVSGTRRTTLAGRLARMGFADAAKAEQLITADLGLDLSEGRDETVLAAIAGAPTRTWP